MAVNKLNKTFISNQILTAQEMNQITNKVDELVDGINTYENNVPDTSEFATKDELNEKANISDLDNYVTTVNAESTYAKKDEIPSEYTLPIASDSVLGGVKVGAGLSINSETGVLSVTGGGTADSVDWANITSKPEFKTVATSGSYNDLTDTPTIPTKTSELENDSNYLTSIPEEYVTETELDGKNYATTTDLGNYVTTSTANSTFATKEQLGSIDVILDNINGEVI